MTIMASQMLLVIKVRFILEYESEFTSSSLELCRLRDLMKIYGGVKTRYDLASSNVHLVDSNNY
ncbi:MAG TPA: hypothetical protein VFH25_03035 [Nitrososphaeraceae archaeon]|nr:hypothetical protein [Nitrososphaeraceae archaeon]